MDNKPSEKDVHEVIERRSTGKTSFAQFFGGITYYWRYAIRYDPKSPS